jgi:phytoene synthase
VSGAAPDAAAITRASKSNLALAFVALPRERREDMSVFYAWCRTVDDLADDATRAEAERRAALGVWRRAVIEPVAEEPALAEPVRRLIAKHALPVAHFHEIIAGMEMDLERVTYATWDELRLYCHRVASVVGLVSAQIFGAHEPATRQYALDLGLALQITNILRDVGEDFANDGRVYLPREEMARFGYTADDLAARRVNDAFRALMESQAQRAAEFFRAAADGLPRGDRKAMVAAEIMRGIYSRLLERMRGDGFRVFDRRYRLSRAAKVAIVAREMWRCR